MYYVTKTYDHSLGLSACFRQWRAKDSHCRFLHGYSLSFKLIFSARSLNEQNWVINFGGLKEIRQFLVDNFDHKLVLAIDDPALDGLCHLANMDLADTVVMDAVGCEAFAKYVHDYVTEWLLRQPESGRVRIVSVEVREHGGNSAVFGTGVMVQ